MLSYSQDKEPNPLESEHHYAEHLMWELLRMQGSDWLEEYAKNMKMYTTVKKFWVSKIVMFFFKED